MADVQLEHGYLRIANRLYEALLVAGFSLRQFKILHGLIRLTYGWSRRTVTLSLGELAEVVDMTNSGTFRSSLHELVDEGVVIIVHAGGGGLKNTYAIQKDFTQWGRWTIHPDRLSRRFGVRPDASDQLMGKGKEAASVGEKTRSPYSDDSGDTAPPIDQKNELPPAHPQAGPPSIDVPPDVQNPARVQADPLPVYGQTPIPHTGRGTTDNSLIDSELQAPKDTERQDRQITATATRARAREENGDGTSPEVTYAIGLATATNNAIARKPGWGGESPSPLHFSTATQLAADLIAAGVELELARSAIAKAVERSRRPEAPKAIEYFRQAIFEAARAVEQRELDRGDDHVQAPVAHAVRQVVTAQGEQEKRATRADYDAARRRAGERWAQDPANRLKYAAIVQRCSADHAALLDTSWGQTARDKAVIIACADAAGFEAFEVWQQAKVDSG
jgi:phage replication O-like protein O